MCSVDSFVILPISCSYVLAAVYAIMAQNLACPTNRTSLSPTTPRLSTSLYCLHMPFRTLLSLKRTVVCLGSFKGMSWLSMAASVLRETWSVTETRCHASSKNTFTTISARFPCFFFQRAPVSITNTRCSSRKAPLTWMLPFVQSQSSTFYLFSFCLFVICIGGSVISMFFTSLLVDGMRGRGFQ